MGASDAEAEAIEQVARDYFEAWYDGDVGRMEQALHPDLVKRSAVASEAGRLGITTKDRMLELTDAGEGETDGVDRHLDIEVLDVYGDTASAVVSSASYHEHLHLVRGADGRWRIANAFWAPT
jgi:Putative lumazine-binding